MFANRIVSIAALLATSLLLAACENSGGVNVMGEIGRPDGAPGSASAGGEGGSKNPDGSPNLSKIMTIAFADARWDEEKIPKGEQCKALRGDGSTPALSVNGIPKGTSTVTASYQATSGDKSKRGDMGVIGYKANGWTNMLLPSVPGETRSVPNATVVSPAPGYAGYLPPCRKGVSYEVTVQALDSSGRALATKTVSIGKL
ncbi:hypothetical protein ACKTEK_11165 [Tepidamorphus sp. 3E244]|uniref:hypothetical protein n=1 Tax=Tepidamorphus sp. 3E244 TaxID=3385498 RepID=UPI0038FCA960